MNKSMNATVLMHVCCAPCAAAVFAHNLDKIYNINFLFCNNNIDCEAEFLRRLEALEVLLGVSKTALLGAKTGGQGAKNGHFDSDFGLVVIDFGHSVFSTCEDCFRSRLETCAKVAKERNFDYFATTLTASPHKNSQLINSIGSQIGEDLGVKYLELDLKKQDGFKKSAQIIKSLGLYRQNYCGCAKSVRQ